MGQGVGSGEWLERLSWCALYVPGTVLSAASGLHGRAWGIREIKNLMNGENSFVHVCVYICATGPWVNYVTSQPQCLHL